MRFELFPCTDRDQPVGKMVTNSSLPYVLEMMVTDGLTNVIALLNSREFLAVIHDFYFGNISQLLRIPNTTVYTIKRGLKRITRDLKKMI